MVCRWCGRPLHWSDVNRVGWKLLVADDGQTYCDRAPGIAGAHEREEAWRMN